MSEPAAPPPTRAPGPLRRLAPSQVRFWGVLVPIHLGAFAALYFGTFALLERAYTQAASTAARFQLEEAVRAMPFDAGAHAAGRSPHPFSRMLAANQPIGLRLYRDDGTPLGAPNLSPDRAEQERVRRFLADAKSRGESWIETDARDRQWMHGLVRLQSGVSCTPCHDANATLGAAAMRADFTEPLAEIRSIMGWRIGWLLAAWVTLIAGVTLLVQRTVRRSAARLGEELEAAAAGGGAGAAIAARASQLPLDPVTAEVHRALRDLLQRQRQREADVSVRLARVDQLASLGQLAAGLAHEIKNPLAGIQGALEVLHDDSAEPETVRIYEEMLGELKRVNAIIYRLLEAGRPAPLRLAQTDLAKLLDETSELLRPSLKRRQVELVTEAAANLPQVRIDAGRIRQTLVNLIQNAAEAMPESGGRIAVRASGFPAEKAVVIAVEDNGPGIAPDHLARIFEPFFTTKFTGTGLGLAISKSLVEKHGGRIEVTSEVGRGTSFLLILPDHPTEQGPEPAAAPERREPEPHPSASETR